MQKAEATQGRKLEQQDSSSTACEVPEGNQTKQRSCGRRTTRRSHRPWSTSGNPPLGLKEAVTSLSCDNTQCLEKGPPSSRAAPRPSLPHPSLHEGSPHYQRAHYNHAHLPSYPPALASPPFCTPFPPPPRCLTSRPRPAPSRARRVPGCGRLRLSITSPPPPLLSVSAARAPSLPRFSRAVAGEREPLPQ